ncbi:receptor-mediated endocytosis protein 6 homolog [Macrosteles quadrilineatus]|uniref:receptor-mediated endocytosis protein 6 homolog n=1 Tax=Macrosteles quadrilineatus TaxID=74068 RepID=UPI0023E2C0E5|nr:receptor-mediated endocytosis protein 6 homolog [Macrosteles quadrilineatus]
MDNTLMLADLIELAGRLRQERLFILSEQLHLQELNEKVVLTSSRLAQLAWVVFQQRVNLNRLVLSRPDCSPAMCCQRAHALESAQFVDAHKILGFQETALYGEFLKCLRSSPDLLASSLVAGERLLPETMGQIINSLVSGLFGSCLLPEDKVIVLRLLKNLTELQLVPSDDPRRLLRHGSCTFARLYSAFHEGLFSAKLFLTAALHSPIMQLLMEDEQFLDIDPDKAAIRFPPSERLKKFGKEGTQEYKINLQSYRNWTIQSLVTITKRFIVSLQENLHCFPTSVSWLVRQIFCLLTKSNIIQEKEVFAITTDLVLTHFICPAIVNPEPYGITDAPISYIARFNLIQVAQILQMLAMRRYEGVDPKVEDLYSQFDKDSVSSMLDAMLEGNNLSEDPSVGDVKVQGLTRNAALLTEAELKNLISFFQTVANDQSSSSNKAHQKELLSLISPLPPQTANGHTKTVKRQPSSSKGTKARNSISLNENEHLEDEERSTKPVLVLPFDINSEPIVGLLSEQKVLAGDLTSGECDVLITDVDHTDSQEKRTRFSLSHDDGSIGNTSDNLEAVSEAASNHSVASSLELEQEDQNDNLSDMVSANVSGRGSPNISGRDTPSSQMTEGDGGAEEPRQPLEFVPPPTTAKQSRFDLDDKFGKFQIKKLMEGGDETVSLVSDTWSTDVLASDSETIEQPPPPDPPVQTLPGPQLLDVSETASEAWSTDVVASDSERLTEVDTDDTASVARSDDTARSEVESRGDSEVVEEIPTGPIFRQIPPVSPSKVEVPHPVWNVTGKGGGKADYRRRTVEYVDSNLHSYKQGPPNEGASSDKPPELKPALVASTHAIVNTLGPRTPQAQSQSQSQSQSQTQSHSRGGQFKVAHTASQEVSVEEVDAATNAATVCLSTVSLASTSSSGSSSEPRHKTPELCSPATPLVLNGSVVMMETPPSSVAKPLVSTGAIPKSISFDKTAERGDKESLDEDGKQKRRFFRNFKLPFTNRRGSRREDMSRYEGEGDVVRLRRGHSEDSHPHCNDTSDDILAKYRRKVSVGEEAKAKAKDREAESEARDASDDERLTIDPSHVEASYAFRDAKKKLRLVLSTADLQQVPDGMPSMKNAWSQKENELVAFLQLQLAEAINLQDRALIAHLHETLRCVRLFDSQGCRKLFESLKEDFKSRSPYVAYLVKCRQSLLSTLAHLDRLTERLKNDKTVSSAFLIAVCVRIFLEKREAMLDQFTAEFQQLTLADEKNDLLDSFLQTLTAEMDRDSLWQAASESQLNQGRLAVERAVISRVYVYAMYPNGDGDVSRDQVLHDHMNKLSKVITPNHKDLRIPKIFHYECPWPSAQAEIAIISAYKTPRDKLQCVFRCATTVMNLLSLACDRGAPAADDLVPVMVYVLIKANPPSLLSTVQYVTSFYANRLQGEEHYWWVQFCSAIEFIKTMDYTSD